MYHTPRDAIFAKLLQKAFHIQVQKVLMNRLDFSQNPQNLILDHFCNSLGPPHPLRLFLKNRTSLFMTV